MDGGHCIPTNWEETIEKSWSVIPAITIYCEMHHVISYFDVRK